MSSVKYFGRKSPFYGRPLWEIVMNLKNFGKGRLVVRTKFEREYPPSQPTFYKILSVHPHVVEYPENFRGNIIVEKVFRGVRNPNPVDIGEKAVYPDFRLVLKEDEPELLERLKQYEANPLPKKILPKTAPLPPIWKEIIARETNTTTDKVPEIPLLYGEIDEYDGEPRRVAKEGEKPDFLMGPGHFTPRHPEFFQHVIKSREEAREKFCKSKPELGFVYENKKLNPVDIQKASISKAKAEAAALLALK